MSIKTLETMMALALTTGMASAAMASPTAAMRDGRLMIEGTSDADGV